jgi:hypothetical protein
MTVALIDGDILVYRCGFAAEKTHYLVYGPESEIRTYEAHKDIPKDIPKEHIWSRKEVEPVENALQAVNTTLDAILRNTNADAYEIFLSGKRSFREQLAFTKLYKGNRDGQSKPVHYTAIREFLLKSRGAVIPDGDLEADDAIGIRLGELGNSGLAVSIDKDLLQIPGRHYNWVSGEYTTVSARDGHLQLGSQVLSGDPTDNVPGLEGIGPVKARKLLEDCSGPREMLDRIRNVYLDHCGRDLGTADRRFQESLGLVYILRSKGDSSTDYLRKYSAT